MKDTRQPWFKAAKYGLFIHWGLYALLAGQWQGRRCKGPAEWILHELDIPGDAYARLAEDFNPQAFDADALVEAAQRWGMKYIVFTAKHHDGFALYDSACSPYNVVAATPFGRDVVRELKEACDRRGMKLGLYYSQAQDWHDPDGYWARRDNTAKHFPAYLERKCKPQLRELLTGYGDIALIWFDTPIGMTKAQSQELFDYVKHFQPHCLVSGRVGNDLGEYQTTGDNCIPAMPYPGDWEVPATLNHTWGYKAEDTDWKSSEAILDLLLRVNARGGNLLLNLGPDSLGRVPGEAIRALDEAGRWIQANAESIYGTRDVPFYPYDMRQVHFTAKAGRLYIHAPRGREGLTLMNIANTPERAYLLEGGGQVNLNLHVRRTSEGSSVWSFDLPPQNTGLGPLVICVELKEAQPLFEPIPHWA